MRREKLNQVSHVILYGWFYFGFSSFKTKASGFLTHLLLDIIYSRCPILECTWNLQKGIKQPSAWPSTKRKKYHVPFD